MKKEEIKNLLPAIFQRTAQPDNALSVLLDAMEHFHAPSEAILENLDEIFDPRRTRSDFVSFLSSWVDLSRLFEETTDDKWRDSAQTRQTTTIESGRLRELIANAAYLSKWRGTKKGLLLFLQIATGEENFEIEEKVLNENRQFRLFHIRVLAPEKCREQKDLIERVIEFEKPVYVTYELEFVKAG